MDSVPKLVPIWHNVALKDLLNKETCRKFAYHKYPAWGGIGVDITFDDNLYSAKIINNTVDQAAFTSRLCAVPFLPPNKVVSLNDPCLEPIKKQRRDFGKFCSSLEGFRRTMHKRGSEKFQNEILSSYKKLNKWSVKKKTAHIPDILIRDCVLQLAENFPEDANVMDVNFSYAGGCLATSRSSNQDFLLHPYGKRLDKLSLTGIKESFDSEKCFKQVESQQTAFKLKGGIILQITSALDGSCYVRQKDNYHFVDFENPLEPYSKCIEETGILNISASPYNPLQLLLANKKEELKLNDTEINKTTWTSKRSCVGSSKECSLLQCDFGAHPMSALCLSHKSVYSFDMRAQKNVKTELFSTKWASCYDKEKLVNLKHLKINPFQCFIASDSHMFICDERYAKKPVMVWSHMLNGYPLYCDIASYYSHHNSSDTVAVFGTQDTCELIAFFINSSQFQIQPVSLSPPLSLSSPVDCINSLKLQCIDTHDSLLKRMGMPLVGVSVIPFSQKTGFAVFQLSSIGDIYYQDFEKAVHNKMERTFRVDTGCVLPSPDKILPHLQKWMLSANVQEKETVNSNLRRINVDLSAILNFPQTISSSCVLCRCSNSNDSKEFVSCDPCPACGLESVQSEKLCESFRNLSLQAGTLPNRETFLECDISSLSQFKDSYSMRFLDPWMGMQNLDHDASPWDLDSDNSVNSLSPSSRPTSMLDMCSLSAEFLTESQDYSEQLVPPSQELRPLAGETLRTPKKSRLLSKPVMTAGF